MYSKQLPSIYGDHSAKFKLLGAGQTICGSLAAMACRAALAFATYRDLGASY